MAGLMDILSGAGAALDLPGSMVRDTLGGQNPFDQLASPFSWDNRLMGRDLLHQYGLAGEDPTGMNMAGGVLTEMALDPLMWAGAGLLSKGLGLGARGAKAASTATRAARPAKALSVGMRPATAASFASPALGAYFIGDNMTVPLEEQQAWKNWLGAGLMAAPLAMAGAKGLKGLAKGRQAVQSADALQSQLTQLQAQRQALSQQITMVRRNPAEYAKVNRQLADVDSQMDSVIAQMEAAKVRPQAQAAPAQAAQPAPVQQQIAKPAAIPKQVQHIGKPGELERAVMRAQATGEPRYESEIALMYGGSTDGASNLIAQFGDRVWHNWGIPDPAKAIAPVAVAAGAQSLRSLLRREPEEA